MTEVGQPFCTVLLLCLYYCREVRQYGRGAFGRNSEGSRRHTSGISEKTQRGTHTTRHCEIISIDENSRIVDTPGFSNLKFDFLMPNEVDLLFPEIAQYKSECKYQDCLHISETGCCVKEHLNEIDETRYLSYIEFVAEAKEYKERVKYQGIKTESTHKLQHNKTAVKISSRKRESARNTLKQNIYKDIEDEGIN